MLHSPRPDNEAPRATPDITMHIVVIAWLYVALMMGIAEATNTTGTVLGGIVTFVMYGLAPVALVVYLMGAPGRRRRIHEREAAERAAAIAAHQAGGEPASPSAQPGQGGETSADAIAPVREKA